MVEYVPGNAYGFFTGNPPANNVLSFASYFSTPPTNSNFNNDGSGGLIEGAPVSKNWHCIPDYYDDFIGTSPAPTDLAGANCINNLSTVLNASAGTQYVDVPS